MIHLTTNEINQGSSGFLLRLPFSLNGYSDSYIGQTWRVKIVTPDGTIVSRTTGIEFLTDAPYISVPIEDFDLILAGTYYYQVTLITDGANVNSRVENFFIKPSLPEGLPYSIISSAMNYFPIFTSGGALAQSTLRVDGSNNLNYSGGGAVFAGQVTLSDEAYSSAWDGKLEAPTKNAIYDLISTGTFGEVNTASNVGTSGIGVFHSKSGLDLQFRKLNSTTNRLTVALNSNQIDFTINEGNLSIASSQVTGDFAQSRITGLVTDLANKQPKHSSLDQISALTPSNDDIIQRKAGVWTNRTVTQFKSDLNLTKTDVGLGNVDNTSDALKPISSVTQGALDSKADKTGATFTGPISVPDDAYGVGWNGNTTVPTKNAIYDKIESLTVGGVTDGDKGDITVSSTGTVWTIDSNAVTNSKINDVAWSKVTGTPTTLAGYGITDAIDGSGANQRVAYFSDSNTLTYTNSLIFTGTFLGIGSSPTFPLHVFGTNNSGYAQLAIDGSVAADVFLRHSSGPSNAKNWSMRSKGGVGEITSYNDGLGYQVQGILNFDLLTGKIGIGLGSTAPNTARLHVLSTSEQLRVGYDSSNYFKAAVSSTGLVTLDAVGSGAEFVFSDNVEVPDEAYDATGWNGNFSVPTKNAIRDKIESMSGITDGDKGDINVSGSGTVWTIDNDVVTYAKIQNVSATSRILGRITTGAGDIEELTASDVKTILALTKADVGLSNVQNVDQTNAANITTGTVAAARLGSGSGGSTKFLREDSTWQTITAGMTVGNAVSGGTNSTVLYKDSSGNLASNSNLGWNGSVLSVTGNVTVTDQAYGSGWDSSVQVPTKNAIYDRLQLLHNYVVVEDHASFASALSYIATNFSGVDVELRISTTIAVTTDTVVPSNVYISFNGSGKFNISAGVTLEIRSIINPGPRKINVGAGKLIVSRNGEVWAAWWCGKVGDNNPQYADITSVMWDGMISSGYGSVIIRFTEGRFRVNGFSLFLQRKTWNGSSWIDHAGFVTSGVTIKGAGNNPDPTFPVESATNYYGTIIQQLTDGIPVLETTSFLTAFTMEDITFYVSPSFSGQALFEIAGHVITNFTINRCSFVNGDIGTRLKSFAGVPNGNYIINMNFNNCNFNYQKVAGFKSETINNSILFNMCSFHPKALTGGSTSNSYGAWLYYTGTNKFVACTFEGYNINERSIHTPITAHNSSTGLTTVTAHGATVGDVEPVIIRNSQIETNTVVAPSNVTASGNARIVIEYLGSNSGWQFAGDVANTPSITIDFAVTSGDTPTQVATKARTALNANPYVKQSFGVGGTGANIVLTVLAGDIDSFNSADWNFSIQNAPTGGSSGITTSASSTKTDGTIASLPTGYTDKTILYFSPVDADTGYFFAHPSHVANSGLRIKWATLGSNNVMRTQIQRLAGIAATDPTIVSPPKAAIRVEQQYFQIDIDNCQDEGFRYSMIVDNTSENRRPLRISNSTMQSPIVLNSTCYILTNANTFSNMSFRDKYGMSNIATVESQGDQMTASGGSSYLDSGRTIHAKLSLGAFVGGSVMRIENNKQVGDILRSNHKINLPTGTSASIPALELARYQDDGSTALLVRLGGRSDLVDGAEYYYDITRINDPVPSSLLVPATQGYLGISSFGGTSVYDGLFVKGHLASYGAEYNAKQVSLSNSGTVSVDCSLASKFACTITGNITFNFTNARPGQHVYMLLDPTGAYTVTWGTGVYATGARQFKLQTGGYYQFHFEASSGGTLIQLGHHPSLATSSYTSPNPLMEWGADTSSTITLRDGDRRTANSASMIDYTLPSAPVYGTTVAVKGTNTGGFRIYLGNASHLIKWSQGSTVGTDVTTTGTSGYIGSTDGWDYVQLTYWGSNVWSPTGIKGAFTIN